MAFSAFRSAFPIEGLRTSRSDLKSRRLSFSPLRSRDHTIVLDSSSDLEVIEASIQDSPCQFDWIRTPRAARVRHQIFQNASASDSLSGGKKRRQLSTDSTSGSQDAKRRKTLDKAAIDSPLAVPLPVKSPGRTKTVRHDSPCVEVDATPLTNFIEGSRKRNVLAWLSSSQKNFPQQTQHRDPDFDPKVEEVLKSVYGNQWPTTALKKCETDVKKAQPANMRLLASETKNRPNKPDCFNPSPKISKPARRKIFDSPTSRPETVAPESSKKPATKKPKRNVSIIELLTPTAASSSSTKTPQRNGIANTMMTPRRTFLSSLDPTTPTSFSHPEANDYKKNFKKKKDELAAKLFKLFNSNVFDNRLPEDMSVTWNPRMRHTAGFCYLKRRRDRKGVITRDARIVLSPKVIDRADRLRDTLIHEMCHAAAWLIDGVSDNHGPLWVNWTEKARQRFPELPAIKRCHSYDIQRKFVYKCAKCGYCVKRDSKSLDTDRKRCGKCHGPFELFITKKKTGNDGNPGLDITRTMRTPNAFALFVKENYKYVKETHPEMKHAEVMKTISEQYAVFKSVVTPNKK